MRDGVWCHFTAAVAAGFTATLVASPVDVIKTRLIENMIKNISIRAMYKARVNRSKMRRNRNVLLSNKFHKVNVQNGQIYVSVFRYMNHSNDGKYRGAFHCAVTTFKNEGFFAFYKGFNASFTRLVAWNIALWITYEQFKKGIAVYYDKK